MRFKKVFLAMGLFLSVLVSTTALEIKLHKEVKIPFKLSNWKYAPVGGHLIVLSADKKRIIVYDHRGNVCFQWGPELKRRSRYIDISHDGKIFIFDSGGPLYEDIKVHYCKEGKELWRKDLAGHGRGVGKIFLSPDGSYILAISDMETGASGIKCFDSNGKMLWHTHKELDFNYNMETPDVEFSYDSRFFWLTSQKDGTFYLFNSNGNLLMKKKYASGGVRGKYVRISPLDFDLGYNYLPSPPKNDLPREGIYDLNGNFISDLLSGGLSLDGSRLIQFLEGKIRILEFPSLNPIMEYPIGLDKVIELTENLRFLFGEKDEKLCVVDLSSNILAKTKFMKGWIDISYSGKYFVIRNWEEKKIWFYELIY